eukprot:6354654-Amphidinium_carterae.1
MMGEMRGQVQGDLYTAITQMRTEWSQNAHLMLQQVPQQQNPPVSQVQPHVTQQQNVPQVQPHANPPMSQIHSHVTQQQNVLVPANSNLSLVLPDHMSVEEISSDEEGFQ